MCVCVCVRLLEEFHAEIDEEEDEMEEEDRRSDNSALEGTVM